MEIQAIVPREQRADLQAPSEALVHRGGGFSVEPGGDFATIQSGGRQWYVTPVDKKTGIPYPILQHEPLPKDNPKITNVHHARHPSTLYNIQDSLFPGDPRPLSRYAERNAQLQLVRATDHNRVDPRSGNPTYHDYFFGPLPLESEADIFKFVVSSVAGILPKYAIDMRSGEPKIVVPTQEQWQLMRKVAKPRPIDRRTLLKKEYKAKTDYLSEYKDTPNSMIDQDTYVANKLRNYAVQHEAGVGFSYVNFGFRYDVVRHFIGEHILNRHINIEEAVIDEFLEAQELKKKQFLGDKILKEAIDAATMSVSPTYSHARKLGLIDPRQPQTAMGIVWQMLVRPQQKDSLTARMSLKVNQQRTVAA